MIVILLFLGFIFGIGWIVLFFYQRIVILAKIRRAVDKINDYPYSAISNWKEIKTILEDLCKELKR